MVGERLDAPQEEEQEVVEAGDEGRRVTRCKLGLAFMPLLIRGTRRLFAHSNTTHRPEPMENCLLNDFSSVRIESRCLNENYLNSLEGV